MKNNPLRLFLLTLILALPSALARADMGTALMWVPALHLTIVNTVVTFIEAGLLRGVFKRPFGFALISMGLANYVSAFAGFWLVGYAHAPFERLLLWDLYHASFYLWAAWILMFIGSLLLEYPFFYLLFRKSERRWLRSVKALFVANSVSYAILIFLYFGASSHGILTATTIERSPFFAKDPCAKVYFLSLDDGSVWRCRLNGEPAEKICYRKYRDVHERLMFKAGNATEQSQLLLVNDGLGDGSLKITTTTIMRNSKLVLDSASPDKQLPTSQSARESYQSWPDRWVKADLRPENKRVLDVMFGDYGDLCLNYEKPDERWLGLEMPLVRWPMGDGTILPGDQLVMQLRDMIILLDLHTLQMAVLAHGRSPVVVLE